MRILYLSSLFPRPGHELASPFNRLQLAALARRHEVAAIAPVSWLERFRQRAKYRSLPVPVERDGVRVWYPTYFYTPRVWRHLYGQCYLASVRRTVRRVVDSLRPDVLFSCWAHPDGWAAVRLGREVGRPVVVKVIGSDVLVTTRDRRRQVRVAEALQQADGVVAVSQDLADHVLRLGVDPARVSVVSEGTDPNLFCPGDRTAARRRLGLPETGRVILFVGNVLESKGAVVLAEACGRLAGGGAEFTCYVVGRGPDANKVLATAERYAVGGRVVLVGPKPQSELPDWYRAADVVTLPSFSEGIPNVLREAIACGVPFVATGVGGIPELVRGLAAQLVPPGDPVALAEALRSTLADPPVVTAADQSVNLSWEDSADRLAERLSAVLRPSPQMPTGRSVTPTPTAPR